IPLFSTRFGVLLVRAPGSRARQRMGNIVEGGENARGGRVPGRKSQRHRALLSQLQNADGALSRRVARRRQDSGGGADGADRELERIARPYHSLFEDRQQSGKCTNLRVRGVFTKEIAQLFTEDWNEGNDERRR